MGIGTSKPIQLRQTVVTINDRGRNIQSQGSIINTWAEVTNPSGFRDYSNGQTQLGSTKRFLVRFRFDLHPNSDWVIRYEGKDWTVSEIQKVEERQFYWQLTATSKSDV